MRKPKRDINQPKFWTVFYTHKHGDDSWTIKSINQACALADTLTSLRNEGISFDDEHDSLSVSEFRPPVGYKLVRVE